MKKILLIVLGVAILACGGWLLLSYLNKSVVTVAVSPASASITLNGDSIQNGDQRLNPGEYTIIADQDGYITQTKKITVEKSKDQTVSIELLQATTGNIALTEAEKYLSENGFPGAPNEKVTVLRADGFYENAWIVAVAQTNSDPGVMVLKQTPATQGYTLFLGPGSHFEDSSLQDLPTEVADAVRMRVNGE